MRRLNSVASQRGDETEVSQCCGSQPRTLEHKATSREGVMKFAPLFVPYLSSLERVGTVQNIIPESCTQMMQIQLERYGFCKKKRKHVVFEA